MRNAFWKSSLHLLRYKRLLGGALIGALVSAACFGAGLSLLLPVLTLFFNKKTVAGGNNPLRHMVDQAIAGPHVAPWREQLAAFINARIPADLLLSFLLVMAVIGGLSILGSLGRYIHQLLTIQATQRVGVDLRDRLFRRLIHAPLGRLGDEGATGYGSRIIVDTNVVVRGQLAIMGKATADLLKGVAAGGAALLMDWKLALLALVVVLPIGVLLKRFGRTIRRASRRALKEQSVMLARLSELFNALAVVKTHNAEGYERRRFRRLNRRLFDEQMHMRRARALAAPVVETLALFAVMLAASVAAWFIFRRGVAPERFLTVLFLLAAAGASFKPLTSVLTQIKEAQSAAQRVLEGLALESEPILPHIRRRRPALPPHRRGVEFEEVSHRYPGARREALDGINLKVPFGATIAVVGPNGAGKSTLLSLVPRLIEPTRGRVLIDGRDLAEVNLRSLREQIGTVTQQTMLFEGTIADNIAYGRSHTARRRIEAAARAAFAHEFIVELPEGYDHRLGEGGEGLSGGQRQRLAIARAILRDPTILILDEATSQVDADSERKINRALAELRAGRTTFVIAHRLSTVIDADLIAVVVDGRLVDCALHHELLERCSAYQALTHTQLQTVATA